MAFELRLHRIGTSVSAIIPQKVLTYFNAKAGDTLYLSENPAGGFMLTAIDPEFAANMAASELRMRKYRRALRGLVKSGYRHVSNRKTRLR
jgi:putative addiction module antidote